MSLFNVLTNSLVPVVSHACSYFPEHICHHMLSVYLNNYLKPYVQGGDLNFLCVDHANFSLADIGLRFSLCIRDDTLVVAPHQPDAKISLSCNSPDILRLIAGRTDPDTLFFNRRMSICGNAEMGLKLKNFLDSVEVASVLPRGMHVLISTGVRYADTFVEDAYVSR